MTPDLDQGQIDAVKKLHNGCVLCGGVGSGKTRTGITYYHCKVCKGKINGRDHGFESDFVPMKEPKDLYIITTASTRDKHEWDKELANFLLSPDPKLSWYGDKVKVMIDSWNNIAKYRDVCNAFFIFDEQRVSGGRKWAKTFAHIAKKNQWIFLSATPGDNWIDYLYIFIANGFYRNKSDFINKHVIYKRYTKYPDIERYMDEDYLDWLAKQILVNIELDRNTVRHVNYIPVGFDRLAYRELILKRWDAENNEPIESVSKLCYLLRKVVNSDETRRQAALEIVRKHPKLIIFYKYDFELEILRGLSYPEGTVVAEWNGWHHNPLPESERWVYLVQYTSGAEGWNCITTDAMLFYSMDYSYKTMEQAMGRIDRRNTPFRDLQYYILQSRAPIDIAIARALKRKQNFNERRFFGSL